MAPKMSSAQIAEMRLELQEQRERIMDLVQTIANLRSENAALRQSQASQAAQVSQAACAAQPAQVEHATQVVQAVQSARAGQTPAQQAQYQEFHMCGCCDVSQSVTVVLAGTSKSKCASTFHKYWDEHGSSQYGAYCCRTCADDFVKMGVKKNGVTYVDTQRFFQLTAC